MEPLTPQEIATIRTMIQERLGRVTEQKKLHIDRSITSTKSVRIATPLLEAALEREPNFSRLVERLIFEWLGSPDEFLE